MLVHDFGIVGEKKDVHLHDDLILYMMDDDNLHVLKDNERPRRYD